MKKPKFIQVNPPDLADLESPRVGIVDWYNDSKGFGFIRVEGSTEKIFVHYHGIEGTGFRTLPEGATVEFELLQTYRGLQADRVRIIK